MPTKSGSFKALIYSKDFLVFVERILFFEPFYNVFYLINAGRAREERAREEEIQINMAQTNSTLNCSVTNTKLFICIVPTF